MNKVPVKIQRQIKAVVYGKADAHGYMSKDRTDNGIFMDNLVKDHEIGGRLADFMPKAKIKTYIKDAILNRYSKDKMSEQLDGDVSSHLKTIFGGTSLQIEGWKKERVSLHRLDDDRLVIVARGNFVKWETALRKALEIIEKCPGLPPNGQSLDVTLMICSAGKNLTRPDKMAVKQALGHLGVHVFFIE